MSDTNHYESQLWRLLEEQKLTDLSQFHQPGFFDEVPLYSRQSDVDFLPEDKDVANGILLGFALKYLNAVVAYESHPVGYVAAITVWDFSDALIVPNLFASCDAVRELEEKLALKAATTPFGKQIKKLVSGRNRDDRFEVLEDAATLPDTTRVFIAPARPSYRGYVTLDHFRRRTRAAK